MPKNPSNVWKALSVLLVIVVVLQWFLFLSMLHKRHSSQDPSDPVSHQFNKAAFQQYGSILLHNTNRKTLDGTIGSGDYEGVAVTVMLQAPKWFHRRFTVMLHNAMANVPSTWPIQIFSNEPWLQKDVLPLHPGLRQLRSHPRIIWTPLPRELTKKKPKEIMKSQWLWDQVVAENILVFSGNGAFCANSKKGIHDFLGYDYVGVPWGRHGGMGGDGSSHSFRKRSAMLRILKDHPPNSEMDTPDFQFFVKYLLSDEESFKIAGKEVTYNFGGVTDYETAPFVISGTQAHLNWTSRDALLGVCPELKTREVHDRIQLACCEASSRIFPQPLGLLKHTSSFLVMLRRIQRFLWQIMGILVQWTAWFGQSTGLSFSRVPLSSTNGPWFQKII